MSAEREVKQISVSAGEENRFNTFIKTSMRSNTDPVLREISDEVEAFW